MPHFTDMSPARQAWEAVGGALVTGIACGVLATATSWAYLVALALTFVGGLGAGAQHRSARGAALRGLASGGIWGAALVIVIAVSGRDAVTVIPEPTWTMILYSIVVTVIATLCSRSIARAVGGRSGASTPS